jgi:peptidoglycan/xylan/chitin deacetylase (PgdA/CDA1 family)
MEYLKRNGYEPVYLDTLIETFKSKKSVPANWIVLTFDDGFKDFYTNVYPVLKRYGFQATLFVAPGVIGKFDNYLSWEELQIISTEGLVEIGSHALMHSPLTCLNVEEARRRILASKSLLEKNLGKKIHVFAYPYGALNSDIRKIVEESGYEGAAGTVYPRGQFKIRDIYNLRRVYVSDVSKYPWVFKFMLSGYYVPVRGFALRMFNISVPRDVKGCIYVM